MKKVNNLLTNIIYFTMKEKFIKNGIEYVRNGDYYIPNLTVPDDKVYNIGKYGRMHAKFVVLLKN